MPLIAAAFRFLFRLAFIFLYPLFQSRAFPSYAIHASVAERLLRRPFAITLFFRHVAPRYAAFRQFHFDRFRFQLIFFAG